MIIIKFRRLVLVTITLLSAPIVGCCTPDTGLLVVVGSDESSTLTAMPLSESSELKLPNRPNEDQALFKSATPVINGGKDCKNAIRVAMKPKASEVDHVGGTLKTYCSAPAKNITGDEHIVFGVSACLEHDICYRLPGVSQAECDDNFYKNMIGNCGQFYGAIPPDKLQVGEQRQYLKCRRWARTWQNSVRVGGLIAQARAQKEQYSECAPQAQIKADGSIDQYIDTVDNERAIRIYSEDGAVDSRKVRICLHNTASGLNKGLAFVADVEEPRYLVKKKGEAVCDEHPAGPNDVMWTFFKRKGLKTDLVKVGMFKFNASNFAGQKVTFAWHKD